MRFNDLLYFIYFFLAISIFPTCLLAQVSFLPYQTTTIGSWPEVVCIGDINNDGLNDVVLGTAYYFDPVNDYKLFIFTQNLQGNLNSPIIYSYPNTYPGISSLTIEDVNNDNLNDIIIGYGDSIGVFLQNSIGTLNVVQSYYSGLSVDGIKCGDINNDGLEDIAVSHWNENFIRIFYQNSTGFSNVAYSKPAGGYDEIDVSDVNGDGLDDVVFMAGQGTGGIHVYLQNSSGLLNNFVSYFPSGSWTSLNGIAIGDLNNNGRNDVVASMGGNSPNAHIGIWYQDTTTNLLQNAPLELPAYDIPESIEIADLNCDGKNEIITAHGGWMKLSVFEQDSPNLYNITLFNIPYASHYNPYGLSIEDINNDGKKDIVIADYNNGLIIMMNNTLPTNIDTSYSVTNNTLFYSSGVISNSTNYFETSIDIDTTAEYIVTQTDYFEITTSYQIDSIRFDSTYITESSICGQFISDTTYNSFSYQDSIFLSIDTNLISTSIDSVLIEVEPPVIEPVIIVLPELVIPNTITPNDDGINDVWIIDNMEYYPNNELEIFNRNGSSIFKSTNYNNNWNGQYNGQDLPATTYYYVIDLGSKILKGDLSIIRE